MTPTPEQEAIIAAGRTSSDSLLINALAGAAKTTTLVMLAHKLPLVPAISVAFNKKIADDMAKRLPGHIQCSTLNSLGHRVWGQKLSRRLKVDSGKLFSILSQMQDGLKGEDKKQFGSVFAALLRAARLAKSSGYVPARYATVGRALVTQGELEDALPSQIDIEPDEQFLFWLDKALETSIAQGFEDTIDFDDQIYLSTLFGGKYPKFPIVMVDEAQDLSALNHETLELMFGGRIIAVGDPLQCQPAGTLVRTATGEVPIESVKAGDLITAYHRDKQHLRDRKVLGTASRYYSGELIKVATDNHSYGATSNHRCLARFSMRFESYEAVYLMRKGNQYRIGKTVLRRKREKESGISLRVRQEGADAIWLLEALPTREDALANEELLATIHGLPTFCFRNSGELAISQDRLDWMWSQIGDNTARAEKLLRLYGRELEYPIWAKTDNEQLSFEQMCLVRACNLETNLFEFPVADKDNITWMPGNVSRIRYSGEVYSLEIEKVESTNWKGLYISNGIVTGNSIYGFRGAHTSSMEYLRQRFSMKELSLSTSFRCPKEVVLRARVRAPHMQWPEWAKEGKVERLESWSARDIPDGAAIICRNNAPLFRAALRLIRAGRGVKLVGSDIGKALVKLLEKIGDGNPSSEEFQKLILEWERKELTNAKREAMKASIEDKASCLLVFAESGKDKRDAVAFAQQLFAADGPIQLMTGHKAKGLEFSTVFHLDSFLLPSKRALEAADLGDPMALEQERNLQYVITTRSQNELFFINSQDYS